MQNTRRFIAILLSVMLCLPTAFAQQTQDRSRAAQSSGASTQDVTIIIQQQQVRFTAQKAIQEMRLQIRDQSGELIYDSGPVTEPELNWALQSASGETIKSGLYAYTLSVKEAGAESAKERRGHFIVDRAKDRDNEQDRLWITSRSESSVGTELTVAQSEDTTVAGTCSDRLTLSRPMTLRAPSGTVTIGQ
ncbi:MAG TPA: hypothetical protein VNQ79_14155 [Blastocatellia bacterium]|nr:hypothetical protein [Blastocatellia bacterium]